MEISIKFLVLQSCGGSDDCSFQCQRLIPSFGEEPFIFDLEDVTAKSKLVEKPEDSCFGYLLEEPLREAVADAVNAMILSMNADMNDPECRLRSILNQLLSQPSVCYLASQGEAYHLRRVLTSG